MSSPSSAAAQRRRQARERGARRHEPSGATTGPTSVVQSPTYDDAVEQAWCQATVLDELAASLDDRVEEQLRLAGASDRARRHVREVEQVVEEQGDRLGRTLQAATSREQPATEDTAVVDEVGAVGGAIDEVVEQRAWHLRHTAHLAAAPQTTDEEQDTAEPGSAPQTELTHDRQFRQLDVAAGDHLATAEARSGRVVPRREEHPRGAPVPLGNEAADALRLEWATELVAETDLGWAEDRERSSQPLGSVSGGLELRETVLAERGEHELLALRQRLGPGSGLAPAQRASIAAVLLTAGALVLGVVVVSSLAALALALLFLRRILQPPRPAGGEPEAAAVDPGEPGDEEPGDDEQVSRGGGAGTPAGTAPAARGPGSDRGTDPEPHAGPDGPHDDGPDDDGLGATAAAAAGSGQPGAVTGEDDPAAQAMPARRLGLPSARLDPTTGRPSAASEQALVQTVCALLNSGGGRLHLGVDAGGVPVGIEAELASVDPPGRQGYEAWLLALLTRRLSAQPELDAQVEQVEGQPTMVLTLTGADEPVRCRASDGGEADERWVLIDERPVRVSDEPPRPSAS